MNFQNQGENLGWYVRRSHFSCAEYQSKTSHRIFTIVNSRLFFFSIILRITLHHSKSVILSWNILYVVQKLYVLFHVSSSDMETAIICQFVFWAHPHRSRREQLADRADIWKNPSSFHQQLFLELVQNINHKTCC